MRSLCRNSMGFVRTIVPCHRPCSELLIGILGVEVGLLPDAEEDLLSKHVGSCESLASVEDGDGGGGFDCGQGEGRLQAVLVNVIGPDDIVISLVELSLVRPCKVSAMTCTESEAVRQRESFRNAQAP